MRKETILKSMLVLMVGIMLVAMPINALAADGSTDLNDFLNNNTQVQDQGGLQDITPNQNTNTNTNTATSDNTNTATNTNLNTNTNTNTNTEIPKAGLAEDTMMIVAMAVLAITAGYAFKKVNDYKNI